MGTAKGVADGLGADWLEQRRQYLEGQGANELTLAVLRTDLRAVLRLLDGGSAEVNGIGPDGKTPLGEALLSEPDPDVLLALLAHGADVGRPMADGTPPVVALAEWGAGSASGEAMSVLLAAGADPNATNREGQAALHVLAERAGDEDGLDFLVWPLIAAGADPLQRDQDGDSAAELLLAEGAVGSVAAAFGLGVQRARRRRDTEDGLEAGD